MVIVYTGNNTDMAIKEDGFFVVGSFDGLTVLYTRFGNFDVNGEGYLVTKNGYYVLNRENKPIVFNNANTFREVGVVSFENHENFVRFDGGYYQAPKETKRTLLPITAIVENALETEKPDLAEIFVEMLAEQKKIQKEKTGHLEYIKDVTFSKKIKFACQFPFFYAGRLVFDFPLLTMLEWNYNANFPISQQVSKKEVVLGTFKNVLGSSYRDLYRNTFFVRKNPDDPGWRSYDLYEAQSDPFRRNGWF